MNSLVPQLQSSAGSNPKSGDPYLKFHLANQITAVFSMRHVQEAIVLPSRRLTPMPNMPAAMLGLMNRRSRVNWVVDLAQLIGLQTSLTSHRLQYSLIMMQVDAVSLGLAVQQVEGLTWIAPDLIQSPLGQVSSNLLPFLRGYVLQQQHQKQEIVLVLNAEAIVQSPVLMGVGS
ncbi:MAG: purine-binding chemotaxis protein CheW [Microcoleus sp. SIO2G3]|nr:purine-binding chemotaxis protein CheW [Microcoleus sp. SIO2G3]